MRAAWGVCRREGEAFLSTSTGWVVATAFLLWNGFAFKNLVEAYALASRAALESGGVPARSFGEAVGVPLVLSFGLGLVLFVPLLTMRLVAGERRAGSEELLFSLPLRESEIVLGKFLAVFLATAGLLAATLLHPASIAREIPLDWGQFAAAYLGLLLAGAVGAALGLWISSLTDSQIVAAVTTLVALLVWFFADRVLADTQGAVPALVERLSLRSSLDRFAQGVVSTRDVVFHVVATAWFLFLAAQGLAVRRVGR